MKVIILAGGWGSRLGRITELIPKPMVEIGNKPILWHVMKIYSYYGFNDFVICLGVKGKIIKDFFNNYDLITNNYTIDVSTGNIKFYDKENKLNWNVTLIDTGLNTLKGGRIKQVEKYLDPGINMVTYGDGVADINISKLVEYHKSHGKMITITGVRAPSRFGEISEKNGHLNKFQEKPQTSVGFINGGFMVFNESFMDRLSPDEDCDLEIGTIDVLAREAEVMVYKHKGNWMCMDHERDVIYLNKIWKNNQAFWKVWD